MTSNYEGFSAEDDAKGRVPAYIQLWTTKIHGVISFSYVRAIWRLTHSSRTDTLCVLFSSNTERTTVTDVPGVI